MIRFEKSKGKEIIREDRKRGEFLSDYGKLLIEKGKHRSWGAFGVLVIVWMALCEMIAGSPAFGSERRLSLPAYRDKMMGGWLGQMVGAEWGMPVEFEYGGETVPEDKVPEWNPSMFAGAFNQDDLYVELTFLKTLSKHGLDIGSKVIGIEFARTSYKLWHANLNARENLRRGIAPPDSGHPRYNGHADDIDYQIESDFTGLISPGMPGSVVELGERFGRMINYGDGVYGGQFMGGMYAEAFFEDNIERIVRAGLRCIPRQSQYYECITDVMTWHAQYPDDWDAAWRLINEKYHLNPNYRLFSCRKPPNSQKNIDSKINGAYVVTALLYGEKDIEKTIKLAVRCGHDTDCNASSAAGVLFTILGFERIQEKYKEGITGKRKFSGTYYDLGGVIADCESLAKENVIRSGGSIETAEGEEVLVIIDKLPKLNRAVQSWKPEPITGSRFTEEELAKIHKE